MRNFNKFVSASLLTTTAIVGNAYLFTPVAISQTIKEQQLSNLEISQNTESSPPLDDKKGGMRAQNPEPTPPIDEKSGGVRNPNNENKEPVDEKGGGSRPVNICPIAPQSKETTPEVWSDRPLFVWLHTAGKIEVRKSGSKDALWSKTFTGQERYVMYGGDALQPGKTYSWVIFDLKNNLIAEVPFQVMETEKRAEIEKQLQVLERELKAKKASAEDIALSRADYFAQRKLWSDVWREISLVQNPSAAVATYVRNIPIPVCSRASVPNSSLAP